MSRNLTTQLVAQAEHALTAWFGDDLTREDAARYLPRWRFAVGLDDDMRAEVLARFSPAEPPAVPGLDWLPSPDEVASYTAAVAESLDVPAPVKELPAREGKWRFGDACGPEHTYRDACQYAAEAKS